PVGPRGEPVLAPPGGASRGVVEGKVSPCITVGAVVLADGPPLPAAHIRAPEPPRVVVVRALSETSMFGGAGVVGSRARGHTAILPRCSLGWVHARDEQLHRRSQRHGQRP